MTRRAILVAPGPTVSSGESGASDLLARAVRTLMIQVHSTSPLHPVRTISPRVSVIVPTYNEAENLPHVFAELPLDLHEVIVVDGHSVDDTIAVARHLRPDVKIVMQTRRGKGNALACGFAAATGDIIVMLDADGSAAPSEISRYVDALLAGADFAKGTRFAPGGGSSDITLLRRVGNRALNGLVNGLYKTSYTDLCYGYNAFWRHCLPFLDLEPGEVADEMRWGDGFEIETIINTRVAQSGLLVREVPSFERNRIHGSSNLNAVTDGLRVLRAIAEERRVRKSTRAVPRRATSPAVVDLTEPHVIDLRDHRIAATG